MAQATVASAQASQSWLFGGNEDPSVKLKTAIITGLVARRGNHATSVYIHPDGTVILDRLEEEKKRKKKNSGK